MTLMMDQAQNQRNHCSPLSSSSNPDRAHSSATANARLEWFAVIGMQVVGPWAVPLPTEDFEPVAVCDDGLATDGTFSG